MYFDGVNVVEETMKAWTNSMYLSDIAALWWYHKHGKIKKGAYKVDTWDEFKMELKRQFYSKNVVYEARKKLRKLKHMGAIHDYVKEFTTIVLQILRMPEDDLLFYFLDECAR